MSKNIPYPSNNNEQTSLVIGNFLCLQLLNNLPNMKKGPRKYFVEQQKRSKLQSGQVKGILFQEVKLKTLNFIPYHIFLYNIQHYPM